MDYQEIIKKAFDAAKYSYSPYSNFKVGACVEMNDGVYFLGTNIENAAYGSTMCAERNAVYGAYCNGYIMLLKLIFVFSTSFLHHLFLYDHILTNVIDHE